jgi:Na+/melibiose symporter-like transporter
VTDALSTPLVGLLSDASFLPAAIIARFGRRKSWHMLGTACVTLSFPFIFNACFTCKLSTSEWWRMAWFLPPIMLFQFGWASCQISHLALIPELTRDEGKRMSMNSFRYGFTVLANLSVFGLLYYLLNGDSDSDRNGVGGGIDPSDLTTFRVGQGIF